MSRSRSRSRSRERRRSPSPKHAAPSAGVRSIFLGNLPRECTVRDVEELVAPYGVPARVDLKDKFAFVMMSTQDEADRVTKNLHRTTFRSNTVTAEFAKRNEAEHARAAERDEGQPCRVLFVVNFNPAKSEDELRDLFVPFGSLSKVSKRGNFCLVEFGEVSDATKALQSVTGTKEPDGREIKCQYSWAHRNGIKPPREDDSRGARRDTDGRRDYSRSRYRDEPYRRRSRSRSRDRRRSRSRSRSRSRDRRSRRSPY